MKRTLLLVLALFTSFSAFSYYEDETCILIPSFMEKETGKIFKGNQFRTYSKHAFSADSKKDCFKKAIQVLNDDLNLGYTVMSKIEEASESSRFEHVMHWEYVTGNNPFTANLFNPNGFVSKKTDPESFSTGDMISKP